MPSVCPPDPKDVQECNNSVEKAHSGMSSARLVTRRDYAHITAAWDFPFHAGKQDTESRQCVTAAIDSGWWTQTQSGRTVWKRVRGIAAEEMVTVVPSPESNFHVSGVKKIRCNALGPVWKQSILQLQSSRKRYLIRRNSCIPSTLRNWMISWTCVIQFCADYWRAGFQAALFSDSPRASRSPPLRPLQAVDSRHSPPGCASVASSSCLSGSADFRSWTSAADCRLAPRPLLAGHHSCVWPLRCLWVSRCIRLRVQCRCKGCHPCLLKPSFIFGAAM